MKTIEARSLANGNLREIRIDEPINEIFKTWYELFVKRTNKEPTLIEVFYAGYVLSNPNVRDLFRIFNKKEKN